MESGAGHILLIYDPEVAGILAQESSSGTEEEIRASDNGGRSDH